MKKNALHRALVAAATVLALTVGPLVLAGPAAAADAAPSVPGRTGYENVWPGLPDHPAAAAYVKAVEPLDWWIDGATEKHNELTYRLMHDHNLAPSEVYNCGIGHGYAYPTVAECMEDSGAPVDQEQAKRWALEAGRTTHTHKSFNSEGYVPGIASFRAPVVNEDLWLLPDANDDYPSPVSMTGSNDTWTVTLGQWTKGTKVTFQWFLDGKAIAGATLPFYNPRESDVGHMLHVTVTGRKDGWHPYIYSSEPSRLEELLTLEGGEDASITGNSKIGSTLTANPGTWPVGTTFTYQWHTTSGTPIKGATKATYVTTAADSGQWIDAIITAHKPGFSPGTGYTNAVQVGMPTLVAGTPTIIGTERVGSTLTARPGTWTSGTSFRYMWFADGAVIYKATSATFTPTSSQLGKEISVRVIGSKSGYNGVSMTSKATARLAPGAPAPGIPVAPVPTISGTARVGAKLTAKPGTWTAGTKLAYQWIADGTAISGARGSTFTPGAAQRGKTVIVRVEGKKSGYATAFRNSKSTAKVAYGTLTAPLPTVSGAAKVGMKLTAKSGTWTTGTKLTYQWLANGKSIPGATASGYTPGAAQRGAVVSVKITGTKTGYTTTAKTSKATTKVATGTLTAPLPAISGSAKVGVKLTAKAGSWTAGTKLSYQWLANGKTIGSATRSTFTPGTAQRGSVISVKITGTKTGYTTTAKTSKATAKVATGTLTAPLPTVSGTARVGMMLTAKSGTWTTGTKLTYQWLANGKTISKQTRPTLKLAAAQRGTKITVKVTGTKAGYSTAAKVSMATPAVAR